MLLACLAAAPLAAVLLVAWAVRWAAAASPTGAGPDLGELAVPVVIAVGGAVVGVAVARWLPHPLAAVPAILTTAVIAGTTATSLSAPTRWLSFWLDPGALGLAVLDHRPTLWHLVWLGAGVAVMAVVALLRNAVGRPAAGATLSAAGLVGPVAVLAMGAVVVAALSGWAQTRPLPEARLAAMVTTLERPAEVQVCRTEGLVTACAYDEHSARIDEWLPVLQSTLAAVPADARRPLVARQRVPTVVGNPDCGATRSLDVMAPSLRRALDPDRAWPADGLVHPPTHDERLPCGGTDVGWFFTAVQAGAWAVGLPPAPHGLDVRCAADGQARAALALYLGGRGVAGGQSTLALVTETAPWGADQRMDFGVGGGRIDYGGWDQQPQWGVAWHRSDTQAAARLLGVDPARIAAVLEAHWERLVDPSTPTAELLTVAGLEPIPGAPTPAAGSGTGCVPLGARTR